MLDSTCATGADLPVLLPTPRPIKGPCGPIGSFISFGVPDLPSVIGSSCFRGCRPHDWSREMEVFVEASVLLGDLHFKVLMFRSVTRGEDTVALASKLIVWLEPRGGTLPMSKATSSEFALSARSAPSDCAFVTVA